MKPTEIITADANRNGVDPAPILDKIARSVKSGNGIILQSGNTVLVIRKFAQGLAELHLFTDDEPMAMVKALREFVRKIKNSDLTAVYGNADNAQILQVLKNLGVDVQRSDLPDYNWKALV